jgi:hypothetical protein
MDALKRGRSELGRNTPAGTQGQDADWKICSGVPVVAHVAASNVDFVRRGQDRLGRLGPSTSFRFTPAIPSYSCRGRPALCHEQN